MRTTTHSLFISIWVSLFGIILVFLLAGMITIYSTYFSSETLKKWFKNFERDELLLYILQSENHYFYQDDHIVRFNDITDFVLNMAAHVRPADIRTFLGRELPGFSLFDTDIIVAGEGTDFTSIPIESPPPLEVLLREREMAKKRLEENEEETPGVVPERKTVLVYHTHSWESFKPLLEGVTKGNEAISSNEELNVVALGKRLAKELNERGIGTLHDTTDINLALKEKSWAYEDSYKVSREIVQEAMAANKDLTFLIDIHRDSGNRKKTTKVINGKSYAKIFFIVGKDQNNYEENLQLATELHNQLEKRYPGISRGIFRKGKSEGNGIYNQDLSDRAILIEIGGVENNLDELYNTVEAFADAFGEYYWQAEMVNG